MHRPSKKEQARFGLSQRAFKTNLSDGTAVVVRPATPGDRSLLRDFYRGLSDLSRYQRFAAAGDLNDRQLRYLTKVDNENHVAWIALNPTAPTGRPIGVGRYIRLEDEPNKAELAVTVGDPYQRRNLGTLLITALAGSALANGIDTFVVHSQGENAAVQKMAIGLGGSVQAVEAGLVTAEARVPRGPDSLPSTRIGRRFRAAAEQVADSLRGCGR
jgi:hypothetical protein